MWVATKYAARPELRDECERQRQIIITTFEYGRNKGGLCIGIIRPGFRWRGLGSNVHWATPPRWVLDVSLRCYETECSREKLVEREIPTKPLTIKVRNKAVQFAWKQTRLCGAVTEQTNNQRAVRVSLQPNGNEKSRCVARKRNLRPENWKW